MCPNLDQKRRQRQFHTALYLYALSSGWAKLITRRIATPFLTPVSELLRGSSFPFFLIFFF